MNGDDRQALHWRWRVVLGGLLAAIAGALVFGRGSAAGWARISAVHHLERGAIAAAQKSLAWAQWLSPSDYQNHLVQAGCLRRLGELDGWRAALEAADRHGAEPETLQLERALGNFRWGQIERVSPGDYDVLVAAGAAPRDAMHAVVHGLLAKNSRSEAQQMLDAWKLSSTEPAEASFLRGVCWWSAGRLESARESFQETLEHQPDHEMAHAGLARLFEDQHRLQEALVHDSWLARAAPDRESVRVDLARILRKTARTDEARRILGKPSPAAKVSAAMALELAELEFETGNYDAAREWFDRANLDRLHSPDTLRAASCNAALLGDWQRAEQLRLRIDDAEGLVRRADELKRRLRIDPSDLVAVQELEQVARRSTARLQKGEQASASKTSPLFVRHCASCHGEDGGGDSRGGRYLHPRPRDLLRDKYRLVSTAQGIPTVEDIGRVIRDGMPGTSMPSFAQLTEVERDQLAREVEQLYRQRFRETETRADGSAEVLPVPVIGPGSDESIALGRQFYFRSGCQHCHGEDGTAATAPLLNDDEGWPTRPRNLVRDPMKGGEQAESLFRRIRLGMPGTPHPASPGLSDKELIAVVHFCQSLAREPKQRLTNHERSMRAVQQSASSAVMPSTGMPSSGER